MMIKEMYSWGSLSLDIFCWKWLSKVVSPRYDETATHKSTGSGTRKEANFVLNYMWCHSKEKPLHKIHSGVKNSPHSTDLCIVYADEANKLGFSCIGSLSNVCLSHPLVYLEQCIISLENLSLVRKSRLEHIVWKSPKMSHFMFFSFGDFPHFLCF